MTTHTDTIELEPGDLVEGKYRIGELIAEGGMGRLYRATQEPLGRDVAIKIIKLEGASADKREKWQGRFFREASLASRLNHPNTVTVIDYGEYQKVGLFLVMEYLDGVSLRDTLNHYGTLDIEMTVHIAVQIANSLADAHEAGVVHRDLKPPNVMLMRRGDDPCFVKVVDFGLVKELDPDKQDDELTGDNALVGSPTYMAPERFLEKDANSPAVDIYALGVVMYEMIVGRAPFVRGEKSTLGNLMMQHINEDPPPMSEFLPGLVLPDGLETLIMRCLAKNPEDRFDSMDYVLRLLRSCEAAVSDHPASRSAEISFDSGDVLPMANTEDQPKPTSQTVTDTPGPSRRTAAIVGLGVVVVLLGMVGLLVFNAPSQRVQIVTDPVGAQVFDGDGVVVGLSPLIVERELFPTNQIRVVHSGFEPVETSIPETDDAVVKLEFALSPLDAKTDPPLQEEEAPEPTSPEKAETEVDKPTTKTDKSETQKPKKKPIDIKLSR